MSKTLDTEKLGGYEIPLFKKLLSIWPWNHHYNTFSKSIIIIYTIFLR